MLVPPGLNSKQAIAVETSTLWARHWTLDLLASNAWKKPKKIPQNGGYININDDLPMVET